MADEARAVDEDEAAATAETAAYQWPRRPGAKAGGPGLPAGGPPVAFAAEPGRPLGPVVPWLIRSFRVAGLECTATGRYHRRPEKGAQT